MEDINILILSAGRRVELIDAFKEARTRADVSGNIITADISSTAPAIYMGDKNYKLPKVSKDEYIDALIYLCRKEKINIIIPTIDTELKILSQNRTKIKELSNANVLLSSEKVIEICRDKNMTYEFFIENGFNTPLIITEDMIDKECYQFPLFIKPKDGSSSINAYKVNNIKELDFFKYYIKSPIIQEFIEGEEYTIDCFMDFEGKVVSIVPRKRISTRGGEILQGEIVKDIDLIKECQRLMESLDVMGPITVQCIKNDKGIFFIEINPRFGGGAPMSIKAGANSLLNIYKLLKGEILNYDNKYKDNILALRYDNCIYITKEGAGIID